MEHGDRMIAKQQSAYMKNKFAFYGIKSPLRKELQRPFLLKESLPEKIEAYRIAMQLWKEPQRELHYFAMDLLVKYKRELERDDIQFFETLIQQNSWWDSIDYIAPKLVGDYFKQFTKERDEVIDRWLRTENIWLKRSAVLFQLKYKSTIDLVLLTKIIDQLKDEKEFFITKAIGWILRETSKHDPDWVIEFINMHEIQPLSKREGLKIITKGRQ